MKETLPCVSPVPIRPYVLVAELDPALEDTPRSFLVLMFGVFVRASYLF